MRLLPFFLLTMMLGAIAVFPERAEACRLSPLVGNWENIRQETNVLSTVEIVGSCEGRSLVPTYRVRVFEKCRPRDCSWGWADKTGLDGRLLKAQFDTFSAQRLMTFESLGTNMRVLGEIDYRTEGREDIRGAHILVRKR